MICSKTYISGISDPNIRISAEHNRKGEGVDSTISVTDRVTPDNDCTEYEWPSIGDT